MFRQKARGQKYFDKQLGDITKALSYSEKYLSTERTKSHNEIMKNVAFVQILHQNCAGLISKLELAIA